MKIERLFHVLVVTGASTTVGLVGCGSSSGGGGGTGGASATGDGASGASSTGGGTGASCDAVCHPSASLATWTDCNGCCCWLAAGTAAPIGSPTCGAEPCCVGRGRTTPTQ